MGTGSFRMPHMAELLQWLKAVRKHWVQELIGGVLIGLLAVYSEMSGTVVAPRVYEYAAGLLLFYAMFLAWRDEYRKRLSLEAEGALSTPPSLLPTLVATIQGIEFENGPAYGKVDYWPSNCNLALSVRLRNPTDGIPSMATEWGIEHRGKLICGKVEIDIEPGRSVAMALLPAGLKIYGTISFRLKPEMLALLQDLDWQVRFKDSADRLHYAEFPTLLRQDGKQ